VGGPGHFTRALKWFLAGGGGMESAGGGIGFFFDTPAGWPFLGKKQGGPWTRKARGGHFNSRGGGKGWGKQNKKRPGPMGKCAKKKKKKKKTQKKGGGAGGGTGSGDRTPPCLISAGKVGRAGEKCPQNYLADANAKATGGGGGGGGGAEKNAGNGGTGGGRGGGGVGGVLQNRDS